MTDQDKLLLSERQRWGMQVRNHNREGLGYHNCRWCETGGKLLGDDGKEMLCPHCMGYGLTLPFQEIPEKGLM